MSVSAYSVSLSANAGVSLQMGPHRIWVDALHTRQAEGFSTVSPELWARMQAEEAFTAPDVICFTHCHRDHYDRTLTARAKELWPQAKLILPEPEFGGQLLLQGGAVTVTLGGLELRFFRLPHEGDGVPPAPHYGLLLSDGRFRVLIPGDCAVASTALAEHLRGVEIDLALLNFPWVTKKRGRVFVEEILRPRHLFLYHLPFRKDESHRYRAATRRACRFLELPDVCLLSEPLQRESL